MCMTNDIDKIREITGYEPGKAFIYGFNEDGRMRRECVETYGVDTPGEPVVYDTKTKNFHIFPLFVQFFHIFSLSFRHFAVDLY